MSLPISVSWSELETFLQDKLSPEEFNNLGSDQAGLLKAEFPEALANWSETELQSFLTALEGEEYENDYDDSMDGDAESALASAGFGTDEDYGSYGGGFDEAAVEGPPPATDTERMYVVLLRDIDWDIEGYETGLYTSHLPKNSGRIVSANNEKDALAIAMEQTSDDFGFLINGVGSHEVTDQSLATKQDINYPSLGEVFFRHKK